MTDHFYSADFLESSMSIQPRQVHPGDVSAPEMRLSLSDRILRLASEAIWTPIGYDCPCPTTDVNTAAVRNSSAVSLFLLLVVVATYVRASSAKRKRKAYSNYPKGGKGKASLLTCAPLAAL
jgi:hypothetical protein